ncbi:MAG TPA: hypothetical protein VI854_02970 [Acidimicrobiia bacterium]|nr:hypothetical protein [Acidimicrobiia bacterium]
MARRKKRKSILDRWQTVLDETKDFVDDTIDRIRDDDDDDDLETEIRELRRAVADLSLKLDRLTAQSAPAATTSATSAPKTAAKA